MNRKQANAIMDNEVSSRTALVEHFFGLPYTTVLEALVIWSKLPDCPSQISKVIGPMREHLKHFPEFNKPTP